MLTRGLTGAGIGLLAGAPVVLWLMGRTALATSADAEAGGVPLAAVVVPYVVGLILIRLVPPKLPLLERSDDERLRRQVVWLAGLALLFPVAGLLLGESAIYPIAKILILLGGAWVVLRRIPAVSPAGEHRARIPRFWYWLGPGVVIAVWGYLFFYSPLVETDISGYGDWGRVELAVVALYTFLTASVLEEIFYRVILQTRLEALWGRWPAIVATALLFVAMHVHRYADGPFLDITLLILTSNGALGVFAGYLWSKYRNVWALIVVHGAINGLALVPLLIGW
ncbi:membrane protease YdiL (CAAX protease family) [Actinoplanes lutulentus]|uniref:CAAX prenyl protease-like protein n=1 Tax=Actinoplanes lutulentus TaxID=1287878 RepID=A0A327YY29_9ACTN|nr:type II CAAX endopeptidase family protein [Actinoplanes lutulentus]MBB2943139.1 membrane protease YdiL (CAAX protease family) [Actinoplanes lutulentus]RAK25566.1 CAAX prenyl protease-like protein [Actinoplanes lutulentus]